MENYKFNSEWTSIQESPPASGARYLVTDGDVVVIATYLLEPDGNNVWIFSGMASESDAKNFKVQAWMELPKPIKPPVVVIEENKINN
jgi:hypothetical protein